MILLRPFQKFVIEALRIGYRFEINGLFPNSIGRAIDETIWKSDESLPRGDGAQEFRRWAVWIEDVRSKAVERSDRK